MTTEELRALIDRLDVLLEDASIITRPPWSASEPIIHTTATQEIWDDSHDLVAATFDVGVAAPLILLAVNEALPVLRDYEAVLEGMPEMIAGEVMVCEEHFWLQWPHDDCPGPGMHLEAAQGVAVRLAHAMGLLREWWMMWPHFHELSDRTKAFLDAQKEDTNDDR